MIANADQVNGVMQAWVGCSDRWHTADLSLNEVGSAPKLLREAYSTILENFAVMAYPSQMGQLRLLTTPSLRNVTLRVRNRSRQWNDLVNDLNSVITSLPRHWDQFIRLSFEDVGLSLENMLTLLRRCPQLTSFQPLLNGHFVIPSTFAAVHLSLSQNN
ncbi:hypothetical protein C8R44DRAFT_891834 [Mycena epipterygia]|nr:hypothetical protein C8R44DRAFT_891834 [Mycena epipterygia]